MTFWEQAGLNLSMEVDDPEIQASFHFEMF